MDFDKVPILWKPFVYLSKDYCIPKSKMAFFGPCLRLLKNFLIAVLVVSMQRYALAQVILVILLEVLYSCACACSWREKKRSPPCH